MKLYQLRKIKQLLYVVIGLMGIILIRLFTLPLSYQKPVVKSEVIVKTDTIWTTKTDTFRMNTQTFKTVYIPKSDTVYQNLGLPRYPVKLYEDTLTSKDVTIYSQQYIDGELIDGILSYKLHVPKIVETIRVKEESKVIKSNLYAFGEIGGRSLGPEEVSFGLLYTHRSKWMISYRMGLSPTYNPTHHIGVGYRIL